MESISIFKNFTKVVQSIPLPEIVDLIRGTTYQKRIINIRQAIQNEDSVLADKLKKSLIGFTVAGTFEGGRRLEYLKQYYPFIILDIDKLDLKDLPSVINKIKTIPYSYVTFVSPSGRGIKVIVKVNTNQSEHGYAFRQVANFYEKELGVAIDRSGKDITRLCFMSFDPDAYLNSAPKVFNIKNIPKTKLTSVYSNYEKALKLCAYKASEKYIYKNGNRNNFTYEFALNCHQAGIPISITKTFYQSNYDYPTNEAWPTIESAYRWKPKEYEDLEEVELPSETPNCMPETIFEQLPSLLKKGCEVFKDQRERDVFLTGALGVLSGCLPEVHGVYDGRINFPNLYTFVIAPAASGKGALIYARELGMKYHEKLVEESKTAQQAYHRELIRYESELVQYKKGKLSEAPISPEERPFKKLFIPANSSSAMLIRQLCSNEEGGILFESEADTLGNVLKQDWGGYSDLMRKAFHHEAISYSRKFNDQYIEIAKPKLSVALSGTPSQVLTLIPSAEDGLFSRFLFYVFEVEAKWRDVSPEGKQQNFHSFFQTQSTEVMAMIQFLNEHPTTFQLKKEQWQQLNQEFRAALAKTNDKLGSGALSIVKRMGGILFRIAMILSAIRKFEDKNMETVIYCHKNDFDSALLMINNYLAHSLFLYDRLPQHIKSSFQFKNVRKQLFYEALLDRFSKQEALSIGTQLKIPKRTVGRYLAELREAGYLIKPDEQHGRYEKKIMA